MTMSDNSKLADERVLYETLDRLSRNTKRVAPTAPWIIQALLVAFAIALICLALKLLVKYLSKKRKSSKRFERSVEGTPDIANQSALNEETGMKTRTRGSHNICSKHKRKKPPAVSLYQLRQKQSPSSSSNRLKHISTLQAMSRLHTGAPNNESPARSNQDNEPSTSPLDVSQRSSETEEVSQASRVEESQVNNQETDKSTENLPAQEQPPEQATTEQEQELQAREKSDKVR